ncbi:hypothetical protein TrST_g3064 [Triparma strigata]|uniref:Methyltransferase domain-containing protein n=1 Tax=Triparma strigata TaxID=1606541 RepID=A0A9W7AS97_9STRA|nr:hypothetical protein TrST_g3064 [Triparma strigata]
MSSVYMPIESGLPAYFLPMLDDKDRNDLYSKAIQETISAFKVEQGRAPRVLDLGCGTGMLSVFALRHGAEHVTALDLNRNMVTLASRTLACCGFPRSSYKVVCGTIKDAKTRTRTAFHPEQPFDILVSEILGTLATSENLYEHTQAVVPHMNKFSNVQGGVYVVPRKVTVTAGLYKFDGLFSGSSEVHPIKQAFDGVLPLMDGNDVILMSSQNLSFPLHLMEPKLLGAEPTVIREDSFRVEEGKNSWVQKELCGGFKNITADSVTLTGECYLVLEWTATLSEQTVLKNTVGQYQQFDIRNSHARHAQWGFLFGRVGDPDVQLQLDSVMVKASGWDKGVPRIEVKKVAANPANPNKRARLEDE